MVCRRANISSTNCWRARTSEVIFHGMTAENRPTYLKSVTHVLSSLCHPCLVSVPPRLQQCAAGGRLVNNPSALQAEDVAAPVDGRTPANSSQNVTMLRDSTAKEQLGRMVPTGRDCGSTRHAAKPSAVDFSTTCDRPRSGANDEGVVGCTRSRHALQIKSRNAAERRRKMPACATTELGAASRRKSELDVPPLPNIALVCNSVSAVRRPGPTIERSKSSRSQ